MGGGRVGARGGGRLGRFGASATPASEFVGTSKSDLLFSKTLAEMRPSCFLAGGVGSVGEAAGLGGGVGAGGDCGLKKGLLSFPGVGFGGGAGDASDAATAAGFGGGVGLGGGGGAEAPPPAAAAGLGGGVGLGGGAGAWFKNGLLKNVASEDPPSLARNCCKAGGRFSSSSKRRK